MPKFKFVVGALIIFAFFCYPIPAQDSHYWTHQYGTRSNLLGGAVVGSVMDLSGVYYNPGGLSLIDTDEVDLLMFAKVFQFPAISVKGIGLEEKALTSSELGEAPTLVAGSIPIKGLGNHWLGYSFLNRQETKIQMFGSGTRTIDPVEFSEGIPSAMDLSLWEKLSEPWYGVTWAYKLSDKFGVGVSNYLTFRSHQLSYHALFESLAPDGRVRAVVDSRDYKYNYYSLLWKIGVTYDLEFLTLGLTLTTPGLKIYGDGRVGQNSTVIRYDPDNPDYMAFDSQKGLDANYKSPLSLGIGSTFKLVSTRIYVTAEWFDGIDKYVVIDGGEFASQSNGEILPSRVTNEARSVLNVAVGVEQVLSDHFSLYGSFWTDFSSQVKDTTTNLSVTEWDLYHIMGGTTFTVLGSQITLGMGYGFGKRTLDAGNKSIDDPTLKDIADNVFGELEYSYTSFKWVLGFSF